MMSLRQDGDRWLAKKLPSQKRLHEMFSYNENTGELVRKITTAPNAQAGKPVCRKNRRGYLMVSVDNESYRVHRLIWKMQCGDIQKGKFIDHIDGDKENNRIDNLRLVTQVQNLQNSSLRRDNKSGKVGVYWESRRNKWCARICSKGQEVWLGAFDDKHEAIKARELAEPKHGFHPNHGKLAA